MSENYISIGELRKLASDFKKTDEFYNALTLQELGKNFLKFLNADKDIEKLEDIIIFFDKNGFHKREFASLEDAYSFVATDFLWIHQIPRIQFYEFFKIAHNDLIGISNTLESLNRELKALKSATSLDGKSRYRRNLIEHYINKNTSAKNEIEQFICYELLDYTAKQITTLPNMFKSKIGVSSLNTVLPYSYASSRTYFSSIIGQGYDINHINEVINKFTFLPITDSFKVLEAYFHDKVKFFQITEYWLTQHNDTNNRHIKNTVLKELESFIKDSHILHRRKDVLEKIIRDFHYKDYLSTCYILPLQIEGIFHDICKIIGVEEKELSISSLNKKLDILNKQPNFLLSYEYFAFLFPPIRNSIAHGEVLEENYKNTAMMLYLDLYSVCELALAEEIPLNAKIKLIKQFDEKNLDNNSIDFAIKYIDLRDIEVPNFYNLNKIINTIEIYFNSDDFWNLAKTTLLNMSIDKLYDSKEFKILGIVKSKFAEEKGNEFFKSELPNIKSELNQKEQMRIENRDKFLVVAQKVC